MILWGYGACDDARPHVALLKFPSADFLLHLLEKPSHAGGFSFCPLGLQTVISGASAGAEGRCGEQIDYGSLFQRKMPPVSVVEISSIF
jgi:hypothetical protein